jgi:single-stranded-DNA-specific exonuclease
MMKIKNIDRVAERIKKAVEDGEQIVIYGDSDLDGIASMVIVKETIDNLISLLPKEKKESFPMVFSFSPERKIEGYGLNETALAFIKSKVSGGLIITLDCGITNFKEIEDAKNSGFSVVVVDHHKTIGGIPEAAEIVVDPKQETDDYPFKEYANAGLAFKLAQEILKESMSSMLKDSFLELTALATISDMMIEIGENEEWIKEGLEKIEYSQRPAIRAIFSILNPMDFSSKRDMVSKINSALNSSVIEGHVPKPYLFLIESDFDKVKKVAEELFEESQGKQREVSMLVDELIETITFKNPKVIFEGSHLWQPEYLGAVASRLLNYFNKSVFLYRKGEEISRGTVRVPKGMDAVKAMESCKELLVMFGGHPPAAGFTVKNENIDKFEECLKKYFN